MSTNRVFCVSSVLLAILLAALSSGCLITVRSEHTRTTVFQGVTKNVTLDTSNGEFESIDIVTPGAPHISVIPSTDTNIRITGTVSSSDMSKIDALINATTREASGKKLTLFVAGKNYIYECSRSEFNGTLSIEGACIEEIVVEMPRECLTKIRINGTPIAFKGPMSTSDLVSTLSNLTFDSDKVKIVKTFVQSHNGEARFIDVDDVIRIIETMAFDSSKLTVTKLFRARVNDPRNAYKVSDSFSFDSSKVEAIKNLSQ